MDDRSGTASERWAAALDGWAIPAPVLAQAPVSPWFHDPAHFAADDTLPVGSRSSVVAREVLPAIGGTVLDVGCGGGRASLALVPPADLIVGVDTHAEMLASFTRAAHRAGVMCTTVLGPWPEVADDEPFPVVDVAVCHHVVYNVCDIEPFLVALTRQARLAVVVEMTDRHPQSAWNGAWRHFWGIERPLGPTAGDLVAVLRELGETPEVWHGPKPQMASGAGDPARAVASARRRLCLGEERDAEIGAWLADNPPEWTDVAVTLRWPGRA